MLSKSSRRLAPSLLLSVIVLGACSVRQLTFVPDSELEEDANTGGTSSTVSTGGTKNTAGKGSGGSSTTTGGKTSMAGSESGGTTSVAGSGTGGSAPPGGSGGMPPLTQCPTPHSPQNQPLIDDFEDGNAGLPMPMMGGRAGGWYVVTDGTMGIVMPAADPTRPPNPDRPGYDAAMNGMQGYALHLSGGGFKDWGADIATNFLYVPELRKPCPYYIEGFQGIRFYIKGNVADGFIRFSLQTQETTDVANGGFCDPDKVKCYNNFSKEIPITMDWKQQAVRFTELKQAAGSMMDLNLTHALGIEFIAHGATSTPMGTCPDNLCTFDFWVDQIEFF